MDESYRSKHRAEWERRRAAEQQAEAARQAQTSASVQSPPKDPRTQPSATGGSASIPQGRGDVLSTSNSSPPSMPLAEADGSHATGRSVRVVNQYSSYPSGQMAEPAVDPDEAASLETARRIQAEFESVDEVRAPDAAYRERLLGGPDAYWNPVDAQPDYWLSQQFPVGEGTQIAEEHLNDEEIARRLQETENRRARRLQQPLPRLRSESPQADAHLHGSEVGGGLVSPSGLQGLDIGCNTPPLDRQSNSMTGRDAATEIGALPAAAPDVAAAAAAAGIEVDDDEAVLQAAIAQSLFDM